MQQILESQPFKLKTRAQQGGSCWGGTHFGARQVEPRQFASRQLPTFSRDLWSRSLGLAHPALIFTVHLLFLLSYSEQGNSISDQPGGHCQLCLPSTCDFISGDIFPIQRFCIVSLGEKASLALVSWYRQGSDRRTARLHLH